MKKKSGNISILVIFVLLASSLLGILSMNFVQQMMKQSAVVNSYYKSYYLAKGWLELGLVQLSHRDVGFEYTTHTGDLIMSGNFLCGDTCGLSTSISGTASLLSQKFWQGSGCEYPYVLTGGGTVIVPLFRDITTWSVEVTLGSWVDYQNLAQLFKNDQIEVISEFGGDARFGILILSGEDLSQNGIFFQKWNLKNWLPGFRASFEIYLWTIDSHLYPLESRLAQTYDTSRLIENNFKMYLLISNDSSQEETFCLSVQQPQQNLEALVLPTDTFLLQSQATYANQQVVLDASYAQPIPGFLFSTYVSF